MSFLGDEAEESEHEGEEEIGHVRKYKNKDKRKKQIDSDEEEEDDDEEVLKDLIDDNPIEEDSDNESDGSRKRKKSDEEDDFDDRLEEDDYDLLEENLGMKVKRQKKSFKRIRQDAESDVEDSQEQGDDREAIANQLFEGSDNENERPSRREEAPEQYASDESEVESETDDFIVDDDGQPIADKRKKRKPIFTDAALQEAQDIFGVDFDYEDLDKEDKEEYDEDEEDEDERTKKALRRKKKLKSLYELYEPHELERAGITEEDNRIRNTDIPERMQLRVVPITPADEDELEEEAEWIFKMGFSKYNFAAIVDKPKVGEITPAPQSDWGEDWDKQSGIAVPTPAASVVSSTVSKRGATPGEEDWEEKWEKASSIVSAAPKSTLSAKQGGGVVDDDDNWDKASSIVSAAPKSTLSVKQGGGVLDDDDNWERESNFEKQSVTGGPKSRVGDSDGILPGAESHISTAASGAPQKSNIQIMEEYKPKVVAKIRKALEFMRNQHLEVPFIAFYRKEYIQPELQINDLWKIYKLDGRYCQLKLRKTRLSILFKNMQMYQTDLIMENADEQISDAVRIISEDDIDRIRSLKTSEELDDMYLLFSLYYADDVQLMKEAMVKKRLEAKQRAREVAAAEGEPVEDPDDLDSDPIEFPSTKRKIGGGSYALCKKLGIDSLVKKFGLTPDRFAENLRDSYQRYEVEQYPMDPLDTAKEYMNERLKTQEEALKAAKFMLATQMSREPLVRLSVREVFFECATITVTPTKKGLREIDEAHPCYAMKYIKGKPVRDLKQDQFLKLTMAEEDKLINLVIGDQIKGITGDTYVEEVVQLFRRDEYSKLVQEWNDIRAECCQFALEKLLYPIFQKELRAKLLDEAKEYVIDTATHKLNEWLKVAPYSVNFADENEEDWDTSKGIRVLAIAYVPDFSQASFATVISPAGEPSQFIRLQNIMKSLKSFNESDRKDKSEDLRSIKELIVAKKPHVVVIGGESRDAIMIKEDIRNLIADLSTEDGFPAINVEIVDNELAKVYASSIRAQTDFREYPLILRQAISLGRRMQDPLIEFSQLVNHDDEIMCLRFHPMQDQVAKEELLESLLTQFVNRTNEVGVDINRCISSPFTMNVAQFICGLGPRKAVALVKTLKQNSQRLENRTQLITVCHMGPKIFINCSGFIKIDTNSLGDSTEAYVEVLDGSRVHPETYEWARKMAVDALEYDDEDSNPASALEEILETPDRLEELNLDAFAEELTRQVRNITNCRFLFMQK
ncbi:Transcription elongation factor SPT6 [Folsomia candida]|uniref:Transcription elongation factor SPT6 n=1 Tax=Folsomia candida TaxID=158441 RepID=A0A226EVH4_FOLCA|nr:Transcription elongation factor SPT6 [Folsomia candida]